MGLTRIVNIIINLATKATGTDVNEYTLIDRFPYDDLDRVNIEMAVENYFHINFLSNDEYENMLSEVETIFDLALIVEKLIKN
jgi:hypothetical protein